MHKDITVSLDFVQSIPKTITAGNNPLPIKFNYLPQLPPNAFDFDAWFGIIGLERISEVISKINLLEFPL